MSIKYVSVKIPRSELCTIQEDVPAWEVPILQALHDQATVVGATTREVETPEAADEYARLEQRYPRSVTDDGSIGMPVVAAVYGQHAPGVANLARTIAVSVVTGALPTAAAGEFASLLA